jgi:predicted acetyltransferase
MRLVRPERKYEASWMAGLREFEDKGINGFWNVPFKPVNIGEYVQRTEDHSYGKNIPENWMPATTFWLIDEDDVVGHVNVRHVLVEWSHRIGGHIGFAIRPSAWRKGYGRKILELALLEARTIGLSKVLVTCNDTNLGSIKIIESNGGRFQDINEVKGEMVRRYWIEIP